jgi:hypothetical protein
MVSLTATLHKASRGWVDIHHRRLKIGSALTYLLLRVTLLLLVGTLFLLALALLEQSLWHQDLVLGGNAPIRGRR